MNLLHADVIPARNNIHNLRKGGECHTGTDAVISHVTRHTSHATRHTSHVTRHTSHVTRHTPHVTRHTPYVTRHTSHVTRHTSHATRHTSHVTRNTSHAAPHFSRASIQVVVHGVYRPEETLDNVKLRGEVHTFSRANLLLRPVPTRRINGTRRREIRLQKKAYGPVVSRQFAN